MKKILQMGDYFVSDFIETTQDTNRERYSLDLYLDEHFKAPRLNQVVPSDQMYGQYWYRSGINQSMALQLKQIVEEINTRIRHGLGDIWLDIACNDGTMFKSIPNSFTKVGIDPSDDTYHVESSSHASVAQDYFSKNVFHTMDRLI